MGISANRPCSGGNCGRGDDPGGVGGTKSPWDGAYNIHGSEYEGGGIIRTKPSEGAEGFHDVYVFDSKSKPSISVKNARFEYDDEAGEARISGGTAPGFGSKPINRTIKTASGNVYGVTK